MYRIGVDRVWVCVCRSWIYRIRICLVDRIRVCLVDRVCVCRIGANWIRVCLVDRVCVCRIGIDRIRVCLVDRICVCRIGVNRGCRRGLRATGTAFRAELDTGTVGSAAFRAYLRRLSALCASAFFSGEGLALFWTLVPHSGQTVVSSVSACPHSVQNFAMCVALLSLKKVSYKR